MTASTADLAVARAALTPRLAAIPASDVATLAALVSSCLTALVSRAAAASAGDIESADAGLSACLATYATTVQTSQAASLSGEAAACAGGF
eukprot:gene20984-27841_t